MAPCFMSPRQRPARKLARPGKGGRQSRIQVSVQPSSQCRHSNGRCQNALVAGLVSLGPRSRRWRPCSSSWRQRSRPAHLELLYSGALYARRQRSRAGRQCGSAGVRADRGGRGACCGIRDGVERRKCYGRRHGQTGSPELIQAIRSGASCVPAAASAGANSLLGCSGANLAYGEPSISFPTSPRRRRLASSVSASAVEAAYYRF